jgi:hypothetical protein
MTSLNEQTRTPLTATAPPPPPIRPRKPLLAYAVSTVAVALVVAALTVLVSPWYLPFVAGLTAGLPRWRYRTRAKGWVLLPAAVVAGAGGWGLALLWRVWSGERVSGAAEVTAALAGLPPQPAVIVIATLLVAGLQALCGAWLALGVVTLIRGRDVRTIEPLEES